MPNLVPEEHTGLFQHETIDKVIKNIIWIITGKLLLSVKKSITRPKLEFSQLVAINAT